jgi:3-oxoadipate enol-lactonase
MPFVRARDLAVYYDLTGPRDAPVLVLANSLATSVAMWDDNLAALAANRRVLRYDMRGHGLSEVPPDAVATIETLADDALALLDALGIGRVTFVGLSIGGMLAQVLAARHPQRVERLVLCATANRTANTAMWDERIAAVEAGGLDAIADATVQRWLTDETRRERGALAVGIRRMICTTSVAGYVAGARAVRDLDVRAHDRAIRCPTLIVAGSDDVATPVAAAEAIAAEIPGARTHVVRGAAHLLCIERPDEFDAAVQAFLRSPEHS